MNRDELWLDYLEGELDPALREDLERVLQNSPEIQRHVQQLKKLRQSVKESASLLPVAPDDDAYFAALSAKIESRLDTRKTQSPVWLQVQKQGWKYAAGFIFAVVSGFLILKSGTYDARNSGKSSVARDDSGTSAYIQEMMAQATQDEPSSLTESILSHEDQIDMFMDLAAQKMKSLSEKETQQVMQHLRE